MLKQLDDRNFQKEVLENNGLSLVDFYASWCGPCKMLSPIIEEIAEEREDVVVGKINVDESVDLASQYGVVSIPTLIVFKDGKEYSRQVGFMPKDDILEMLV